MSRLSIRPALFAFACAGVLATSIGCFADEHPILTVCTDMDCTEETTFDLPALENMEQAGFVTSTIWTDGDIEFQGVPLRALLEQTQITSGTLELIASNDYFVEIPVDEAISDSALIAYRMNGELMSPREKGPLWLVFPFDSDAKFQSETYYSKSIWQINRIKVLPE